MNFWKGMVLAVCTAGLVYFILFGLIPHVLHADSSYSGQEVFLSQQSYEDFKSDVKNRVYKDSLKLNTFDVLASEPPIIVNFSITVPYDYEFPYGESKSHDLDWVMVTFMSLIASLVLIVLPCLVMFGLEKKPQE